MNASIALSCGTALGFSHIGVLKFCDEKKINICEISGCSIGSWIGALYSLGYCGKEIENIALTIIKRGIWKLADPCLSLNGILKGDKIYDLINKSVDNKTFSNCRIPLKIIAVNALNGKMKVFSSGNIADAIRASISMPAIFKPWMINNIPYIDGGVGFPINCDILSDQYIKIASISLGRSLKYNKKPNIFQQIFINQTQLNIILASQNSANADIVIQPEMNNIYQWSFNKITDIIEKGYLEAKRSI